MSELKINNGKTDINCQEARFNSANIDYLNSHFEKLINSKKMQAGAYLLARKGKIFAHNSMGKLKHTEDSPDLQPDSLRSIASVTKMFTAVAVMQLVEQGKIALHQPVCEIIKEFDTADHRKIEIFHLLTHTSGLTPDDGYLQESYPMDWSINKRNARKWIKLCLQGPMFREIGTEWAYCSKGFMFLGEIITRISGIPYKEYVEINILKPLGMNRTFFHVPPELIPQVCLVNNRGSERLEMQSNAPDGTMDFFMPGGGLWSTLPDLFKFGQMLLNKGTFEGTRILGRKTVEKMISNQLKGIHSVYWGEKIADMHYGLGIAVTDSDLLSPGTFNHEGYAGFGLYADPAEDFLMAYMVPYNAPFVFEAMVNSRSIVWSGIE